MKRYLTLFFLLITSIALCAYPEGAINNIDGSALGWDEANQVWRPIAVDATGKLNTGSSSTIASISIDTSNIESYLKKTDGGNTVTVTDLVDGIGTDVAKIAKGAQPTEYRTQRISPAITANVATNIGHIVDNNSLATNRVFVELRAIDPDAEFYIGFDNTVTDSTGRPVKGRILLNMPSTQSLYIYHTNTEALAVQHTEGWN